MNANVMSNCSDMSCRWVQICNYSNTANRFYKNKIVCWSKFDKTISMSCGKTSK